MLTAGDPRRLGTRRAPQDCHIRSSLAGELFSEPSFCCAAPIALFSVRPAVQVDDRHLTPFEQRACSNLKVFVRNQSRCGLARYEAISRHRRCSTLSTGGQPSIATRWERRRQNKRPRVAHVAHVKISGQGWRTLRIENALPRPADCVGLQDDMSRVSPSRVTWSGQGWRLLRACVTTSLPRCALRRRLREGTEQRSIANSISFLKSSALLAEMPVPGKVNRSLVAPGRLTAARKAIPARRSAICSFSCSASVSGGSGSWCNSHVRRCHVRRSIAGHARLGYRLRQCTLAASCGQSTGRSNACHSSHSRRRNSTNVRCLAGTDQARRCWGSFRTVSGPAVASCSHTAQASATARCWGR
jgi:hypothetical protein